MTKDEIRDRLVPITTNPILLADLLYELQGKLDHPPPRGPHEVRDGSHPDDKYEIAAPGPFNTDPQCKPQTRGQAIAEKIGEDFTGFGVLGQFASLRERVIHDIDAAIAEERERCTKIADNSDTSPLDKVMAIARPR